MAREVKVSIHGLRGQEAGGTDDVITVVSVGQMYEADDFTCITYDEVVDEEENGIVRVAKNLLKIRENQVEVIKKGPSESHMVFVPEQTTYTYYATPVGELEVSIHTNQIDWARRKEGFDLGLNYELEMNQTFISSCNVNISVNY